MNNAEIAETNFYALRAEGSWDETSWSVFQHDTVEVHQQSDLAAAEAKAGWGPCFMQGQDTLDAFQLQDEFLLDDDVGTVAARQMYVLVGYGRGDLAGIGDSMVLELPA